MIILVVAAHPDDEVLGCGGTIAKLVKRGHILYTLLLSNGKAARTTIKNDFSLDSEIKNIRKEAGQANKTIGVRKVFFGDFPDNRFDSIDLLDIVKRIESVKEIIKPEIIFTHNATDLNIDHQITFKAVLTATRAMKGETVREIYSFEVPSSTEWNSYSKDTCFVPNVFSDITGAIDIKLKAMAKYKSELQNYPHPRSLQHLKELAKVNGTKVGLEYSENFALIRSIGMDFQ